MKARLISAIVLPLMFVACGPIDTLKEGLAHTEAVSASLEKSIGVKPLVGFNWNNGSLTSVTITFEDVPKQISLTDIMEKSKQAVVAEFKENPEQIVVSFTVTP